MVDLFYTEHKSEFLGLVENVLYTVVHVCVCVCVWRVDGGRRGRQTRSESTETEEKMTSQT